MVFIPAVRNVGPTLAQVRRLRRIAWFTARALRRFPTRQWKRVHFTDESPFILFRRGNADACVDEWVRFWCGSAMVWEGIAHEVKSQLVVVEGNITSARYRDDILRLVAVPLLQQRQLILQQDNARSHVARVFRDFLASIRCVYRFFLNIDLKDGFCISIIAQV